MDYINKFRGAARRIKVRDGLFCRRDFFLALLAILVSIIIGIIAEVLKPLINLDSLIQKRMLFLKPLAAAISVGTGGAFGRIFLALELMFFEFQARSLVPLFVLKLCAWIIGVSGRTTAGTLAPLFIIGSSLGIMLCGMLMRLMHRSLITHESFKKGTKLLVDEEH